MEYHTIQNQMTEWGYRSGKAYDHPFRDVEIDILITAPDGKQQRVPAFWAGDQSWRVRYASSQVGRHHLVSQCSDADNLDLHGRDAVIDVAPYRGTHPLYRHGPLRVAATRRHLEHRDGTPFFWLGDTWWMGLCERLRWPQDFRLLTADRAAKGFSVIQIVAGLYPDMPAFDPRGANEAGFPWDATYERINPAYFDMADLRIGALIDAGLVPCLVGCWGYFIRWMGVEAMQRHWRYLIARYGAYPVIWCLTGEATMPYYLSKDKDGDGALQRREWTQLTAYVRRTDPYHHPITIHPPARGRAQVEDPSLLDIDMLQTGHFDRDSLAPTVRYVTGSYAAEPRMPVIDGEVCYEGILEANRQDIQRLMFWACMLSGAAGHTYGANGIWQVNGRDRPYGPSPHGFSWGDTSWDTAAQLPGATQVALGKRLLERYPWWRFAPHPEWYPVHAGPENYFRPYAAGIPCEVRVFYFPSETALLWLSGGLFLQQLEANLTYRAFWVNPVTGQEYPCGPVEANSDGNWTPPHPPIFQDWLLVLDRQLPAV